MMKDTIVIYPSPGRSHLVSMIELAKLTLTYYPDSFSIAVILSEAPFEIGSTSQYVESISATVPSITFIHLPTILTATTTSFSTSALDTITLSFELPLQNNQNFHQALLAISKSSNIKALILDFFCNASFEISTHLRIPTYYYKTGGLTSFTLFLNLPTIHKNVKKSFKELRDDEVINVPGIPVPLKAEDIPHALQDSTRKVYKYFLETAIQMIKSAGIIVNTVEPIEKEALDAILGGECTPGETVPRIYCIGPLITDQGSKSGEEKHECMNWLDMQPKGSVVFLSFGSLGKFSARQLKEMALGLERSGIRFLWVVRPPPEATDVNLDSFLPPGFVERTKGKGFVADSWVPQVAVLSHGSVGGFVTHCGWNSVLEAFRAGLPMLAWPIYAEQNLNKVAMVEVWKVALPVEREADGFVSAAELEKRVNELINSDKGKSIKERVMIMREHVLGALNEGGPSRVALANFLESFHKVENLEVLQ